MKKIIGLDLGTTSIGWALVNEANEPGEESSIINLGVRVNPLSTDELRNFEKGKSITTNADRTLKRSMRRNLQRYKLRRNNLIEILIENGFISDNTILSENGNKTTFETYRLRAKAVTERISLDELARVLLMINKKRGYKSSRKVKNQDEGQLIDGMEIAKKLYNEKITPGMFVLQHLKSGGRSVPDFYRSDLQAEIDAIWANQKQYHPEILADDFKAQITGRGKLNTSKIFLGRYGIYTAENKGSDKRIQSYLWRVDALQKALSKEELAFVISDLNGIISNSSGYLGSISDRSKELFFNRQTVGQFLMHKIEQDPHTRLKQQVFYRQDYLDEFNAIWEMQAKYYHKLTSELKADIRDVIIFYQRKLKSQKGLISFCEFEGRQIEVEVDGRKKNIIIGAKVCPKSSPLFQEFKIWQMLNNIQIIEKESGTKRSLQQDEKEILFAELCFRRKMTSTDVLKMLFDNPRKLELNFKEIEGNATMASLYDAYRIILELTGHGEFDFRIMPASEIMNTVRSVFEGLNYNSEILSFNSGLEGTDFEHQALYQLWHLLYSFEGDDSNTGNEKLIDKISGLYGFEKEYARIIADVVFQPDYGSLSAKAIKKILPYLREGSEYSVACEYAGYRHSKNSLTKEEIENKNLKDKLDSLPKNSLRNPVVEKILNQMVNVLNTIIETYSEKNEQGEIKKYFKPDEIRIELARELKKSAGEREEITASMGKTTAEHETYRKILETEFGLSYVSRNDIIRYKLYLELEHRGYKTLYSNTYIPREKLFSKEFDIEHIIPQSRLFDDSFSNKVIETRGANLEKGNETAYDYINLKYGENGLVEYIERVTDLLNAGKISRTKFNKLKMKGNDIPDDFINRDLRDTQYIAKKAKEILEGLVKDVVSTTGSITSRLRDDWQLTDVMQELNWEKYDALGMTDIIENREGHRLKRIKDWTKRNDHRHHAMDALTIAFTKRSYIQYLNNLNARGDKTSSIYGIEAKELYRDDRGKLKFKPPMPINSLRAETKKHLENILTSIKAKNKVVTQNTNSTKGKNGLNKRKQQTPRGQLHLETVYGSIKQYVTKEEKIGASFTPTKIETVAKATHRTALLNRLNEFGNDPKKAFTGKNSPDKNPIFLDKQRTLKVPEKVKIVETETIYTIRKEISPDLKIDKVIDPKIRELLQSRLNEFKGDSKKAFSNLDENPIWLNKDKGISVKRVTILGVSNAVALHEKKDKEGRPITDKNNFSMPVDFVNTGNNHHVAFYKDGNGDLHENVISFFEATSRASQNLPVIDKQYNRDEGWEFLFTIKQNEYFVFPNEKTGFNPTGIDLLDPSNYHLISPNLFRVQKISSKNYVFNHHLETKAVDGDLLKTKKNLSGITYYFLQTPIKLQNIIKVRINHMGTIVSVGEYY